jgi:hypothetical protein
MRAVVRAVVALLVALLGLASVASAEAKWAPAHKTYDYESQHHASVLTEAKNQRGPPGWDTADITVHAAVDCASHGASARPDRAATSNSYAYDDPAKLAHTDSSTGYAAYKAAVRAGGLTAIPCAVPGAMVAANGGSRIAANQAAGNAARDALAAAHPGSLIEQSFTTTAGVRRLDILTQSRLGIESKVGRTSLKATTRSQIAKDSLLLRNGQVTGMEWVFSRSGVTGQIGPTGPLADALSKAGIPWSLAP